MNNKIIFLCDASVKSGMGHLTRSLAIAESLKELGEKNILFLIEKESLISRQFKNLRFIYFDSLKTKKEKFLSIEKTIINELPKLLFLDTKLNLSKSFYKSLKERSIKIASIDDADEKRLESDILFYPPLKSVYDLHWTDYKGSLNIGWEWIALRREFLKKEEKVIEQNTHNNKKNILITMGGSDPHNITLLILENLDYKIFENFNIKVILGASNPHKKAINKFKLKVKNKFKLIINPPFISDIMKESDFAICTFGVTAYELASLHIPSFHISLNNDHLNSSQLFVQNKMAISLGLYHLLNKNLLEKVIFEEKRLDSQLIQMRENCKKYIDVYGARRIASKLIITCKNEF